MVSSSVLSSIPCTLNYSAPVSAAAAAMADDNDLEDYDWETLL